MESIDREREIHGVRWNSVHEGYFGDPAIAAPLVDKIQELARRLKPDTIMDLGGGTGFLLSRLRAGGMDPGVSLVDLDSSPPQLEAAKVAGLSCLQGSVDSFSRRDLGPEERRCLFIMRSVLHYFGKDGLRPVLRHLRAQARPGEVFVHQTASFRRRRDADVLNALYRMMRTQKWYPTVAELRQSLRAEGWRVLEVLPAFPLRLTDVDLAERYHLDGEDLRRIREDLARKAGVPADIFQSTDHGFQAFLHYWIYVCTPETDTPAMDFL